MWLIAIKLTVLADVVAANDGNRIFSATNSERVNAAHSLGIRLSDAEWSEIQSAWNDRSVKILFIRIKFLTWNKRTWLGRRVSSSAQLNWD